MKKSFRTKMENVTYRIFGFKRYKLDGTFFERVDFVIIHLDKRRKTFYSAFFDEVPTEKELSTRCHPTCDPLCTTCTKSHLISTKNINDLSNLFKTNWPTSFTIHSPRFVKFSLTDHVEDGRPPKTFKRDRRPTRGEIHKLMEALNEVLRRHRIIDRSRPYLATPANPNVDSIYQKTINGNLGFNLIFQANRAIIDPKDPTLGVLYVIN
ncbi:TPA: hypothetical protein NJ226_003531 [Vibrio parahaemolyticus]|nr:hypothetical protein [Vibrio parahaemolyticus]